MPTALGTVASHRTASAPTGPFSPADLPNLIGWFDTDSYGGGGTWDNLGGPVDLVRTSPNAAIRTVAPGYDMVCSYATGGAQTAAWTGAFGELTQPVTIVVVGWVSSGLLSADYYKVDVWSQRSGSGEMMVIGWGASEMICGYNAPNITINFSLRDSARHIFAAQHNGGSNGSWFEVDGVRSVGNTRPESGVDLQFGLGYWTGWDTGSPTIFAHGEIVVVDGTISAGDYTNLYNYLYDRWMAPIPIPTTGLVGWWDADDASTFSYSSGSVVSQWNDKSGGGKHLSQATVGLQPNRNGTQNGKPTVVFDGTDDLLTSSTPATTVTNNLTMFVACRRTGGNATTSVPFFNGDAATNGYGLALRANGSNIGAVAGGIAWLPSTIADPAVPGVVSIEVDTGHWWARLNGGTGNEIHTGMGAYVPTAIQMPSSNHQFGGEIYETIVYDRVLSTVERQQVESYLRSKWGTP